MRILDRGIVVLVHPDEDNRVMYANFLRLHGFTVLAMASADDALPLTPLAAVIVTGIRLRGSIDGVQFIARVRHDDRTRDTPIIVVSASPAAQYQPHAEAAGCDRFLTMPCLPHDLLQEIERLAPPVQRAEVAVARFSSSSSATSRFSDHPFAKP